MNNPFRYILTTNVKLWLLRKLIGGSRYKKILDVGCGAGYLLSEISDLYDEAFGIDMVLSPHQNLDKVKFKVTDAQNLKLFRANTFSCVICTDVLEHIPNDKKCLGELARVLKPSGLCFIYTPTTEGILSASPLGELYHESDKSYLKDYRYYQLNSLTKKVKSAGFQIVKAGYHNVFIQEFATQILKYISHKIGIKYESQNDITNFSSNIFFKLYILVVFYPLKFLIRCEDLFNYHIFGSKIRGHRAFILCRKI